MCAIYGAISLKDSIDVFDIAKMGSLLKHRGPDASAIIDFGQDNTFNRFDFSPKNLNSKSPLLYSKKKIVIGHNRLSILGLGKIGDQPMVFNNRYVLSFNGEIYNYLILKRKLISLGVSFKTNTDSEVILASYEKWGEKCLEKFKGMFAFVIYDIEKKKFFIARDRFGIKPLYYYLDNKGFYFSSEIKSFSVISSWKPKANIKTSLDFLVWSVLDHTEETLFDGVNQIKPGHYVNLYLDEDLNLNNNVISQRCWYNLERKLLNKNNGKNYDEFFMHSLNEHLLSEVKIGSCLSGGLDSSSIVCNVASKDKFKDKFNTVTAQCELKELDETQLAKEVINKYSLKASFVMPSLEKLKNRLDEMIWHQDEPFISTSNLLQFEVFKKANENEIKVMLDGQGADESLAGYKGFIGSYGAYLIKKAKFISFVKFVISFSSHPQVSFKYVVFSSLGKLFPSTHSFFKSFTKETNLTNFLDKKYKKILSKNPAIPVSSKNPFLDDLVNQIKRSSLPMLLHWEDRASMAHSIEARVPFLDHQLVEYSVNISEEFRFSKGHSKVALRDAQKGKVPESILENLAKLGYVSAEEFWMIKKDSNYFRDLLEDALDSLKKIIRKDLLKEYDKFLLGERPFSYLFWRVICYSLWLKKFKVSLV